MLKPFALGAAMAAMMLWMLHEPIMSGTADLTWGAAVFALAHVAVLAGLISVSLVLPRVRHAVLRHRPSLGHFGGVLAGLAVTALSLHLVLHGSLA